MTRRHVLAAISLFLLGLGFIALGLVEKQMYSIGVVTVVVAGIGLLFASFDLFQRVRKILTKWS